MINFNIMTTNTITDDTLTVLRTYLLSIPNAVKIDCALGFIVHDTKLNSLKYFRSSPNSFRLFNKPSLIDNPKKIEAFLEKISRVHLLSEADKNKPANSSSVIELICNITFYFNKLTSVPMGVGMVPLPKFLRNNSHLHPLTHSSAVHGVKFRARRNFLIKDNYCAFRGLAIAQEPDKIKPDWSRVEKKTYAFAKIFLKGQIKDFAGINLEDFPQLENTFQTKINVFQKNEKGFTTCLRLSNHKEMPFEVNFNLYKNHLSFIINIDKFTQKYLCVNCDQYFTRQFNLIEHTQICQAIRETKYVGGVFRLQPNFWETFEEYGITFDEADKYYPFRVIFDYESRQINVDSFESISIKANEASTKTVKTDFVFAHRPACVAVGSNIPTSLSKIDPKKSLEEYEVTSEFFTVDDNSEGAVVTLVKQFLAHLKELSKRAHKTLTNKFQTQIKSIENLLKEESAKIDRFNRDMKTLHDNFNGLNIQNSPLKKAHNEFLVWLQQVVVLGFNSGSFDINLIKDYLLPHLNIKSVIKKGNAYMSILTKEFKFIDLRNYIAPFYSLKSYIQAFRKGEETEFNSKNYFPYLCFNDMAFIHRLDFPSLDECNKAVRETPLIDTLSSDSEVSGKSLGKKISQKEYEKVSQFYYNNFTTMGQYLRFYCLQDILPLFACVKENFNFFKTLSIDMFKSGKVSISGLSLLYGMKIADIESSRDSIHVFDKKFGGVVDSMRENLDGGLSVIMCRYHEAGKTYINPHKFENPLTTRSIFGFDSSSQYLGATGSLMPTGAAIVYEEEGGSIVKKFQRPNYSGHEYQSRSCMEYIQWMTYKYSLDLQHARRFGEKQIGPGNQRVDIFNRENGAITEFEGCYFHAHDCQIDKMSPDLWQKNRERSIRKANYIRTFAPNSNFTQIYECQWETMKKNNPEITEFLKKNFESDWPSVFEFEKKSGEGFCIDFVCKKVLDRDLFGIIEVDIHCPEELKEKFEEYQPIIKKAELTLQHASVHMRDFALEHNMMKENDSRSALIGSFFAVKKMITTPLLSFYLSHGLKVTKIYRIVQWRSKAIFKKLTETVVGARKAAALRPEHKMWAETLKLLGNSFYGKLATNPKNYLSTRIVKHQEANKLINSKAFRSLSQIRNEDCYEVASFHEPLTEKYPIQISLFVYQYGKLNLLDFIYNCLYYYVPRNRIALVQSDTDSVYGALSEKMLEDAIDQTKRQEFFENWGKYFAYPSCEKHRKKWLKAKIEGGYFKQKKCCQIYEKQDMISPLRYKLEFNGSYIVALAPKTYIAGSLNKDKTKLSSKGIGVGNDLTKEHFLYVLFSKKSVVGQNEGIIFKDNFLFTYVQARVALSYLYLKKIVDPDGVTCYPTLA